jgi:predicted permease
MVWESVRPGGPHKLRLSISDYQDFAMQSSSFNRLGVFRPEEHNLVVEDHVERVLAPQTESGFFGLLGVPMVKGTDLVSQNDMVVVLSERMWRSHFRDWTDPLGKSVRVDGVARRIIGIVPQGQEFPASAEMWLPFVPVAESCPCDRNGHSFEVVGRLKEGVSLAQASTELKAIASRLESRYPASNANTTAWLEPLRDEVTAGVMPAVWTLLVAGATVLLMGCVSAASLLLAYDRNGRSAFCGLQVLAAARRRMITRLFLESFWFATAVSTLAIFVARWSLHFFLRIVPKSLLLVRAASLHGWAVGFALPVSFLIVLILASFRTVYAQHPHATPPTEGSPPSGLGRPGIVWTGLVALENAVAFCFLFTAILLLYSLLRLRSTNPGFEPQGTLSADITLSSARYAAPEQVNTFYFKLLDHLRATPGVEAAAAVDSLPMTGSTEGAAYYPVGRHNKVGRDSIARISFVTPGYFETMRIPMLRGRDFVPANGQFSHVIIISTSIARLNWGDDNPVGKFIGIRGAANLSWEVIGLVPDIKDDGLGKDYVPRIYLNEQEFGQKEMTVVVRARGESDAIVKPLRREVSLLDPELPVSNVRAVEDVVDGSLARNLIVAEVTGLFSAIALVLASVGVYGTLLLTLTWGKHEARRCSAPVSTFSHIALLVLRDGSPLVLIGLLLGVGLSFASVHAVESLLYGIQETNILPYLTAGFAHLLVVMTLCFTLLYGNAKCAHPVGLGHQ